MVVQKNGTISSYFKYENNRGYTQKRTIEINNSNDALELIIKSIFDINVWVLNSVNDIAVFDITIGLSPLSGLMMTSRYVSIDPLMIPYIMNTYNMSVEEVINMLNINNGYFAICNSKDAKEIVDRSLLGDEQAILLRNMINNDFKKHLLSMMVNIENVDAIIVTGGIGEKNIEQRELFLSNLLQFGIKLDKDKNNEVFGVEAIISDNESNIFIYVIPTNEEKEIANQCKKLVLKKGEKNG